MDVSDFCNLCTSSYFQEVHIFDMNEDAEDEVFVGTMDEATRSKFASYEVESFDLGTEGICLNIDTSIGG